MGFDGVSALDLTGPLEAFSSSVNLGDRQNGVARYELMVIGLHQKKFSSDGGIVFRAKATLTSVNELDTIVIPGGPGLKQSDTLFELSRWLAAHAAKTRRIAGICDGIYPLAQSGVLDGRKVTTHWRFAHDVARRFPNLKVKSNASFLKDGPYYTCGSGTAGIEMALSLIREDHGSEFALKLARQLVVRLRRPGEGMTQADLMSYKPDTSDKLAELPAWIVAHLDDDLSVKALAKRAGLCPRHFRRLFKLAFNRNPSDYVEQLRLQEASRRLNNSRRPIDSIAASVGYTSSDVFRRAFERWLGVSPRAYRKAFSSGVLITSNR